MNTFNTTSLTRNLTVNRYILFVGLGFLLWLGFLLAIRAVGADIFATGSPTLIAVFVGTVPLAWATIALIAALTGVAQADMLKPVALMCTTALLLDGIAVGFTDLYGPTSDQIEAAAAFLLWGVGVTLLIAMWLARQTTSIKVMALGLVIWVSFLVTVRIIGPIVLTEGNPLLPILYMATFPIVVVAIMLVRAILQIPMAEMLIPVIIVIFVAGILDGLSIGFTDLYGGGIQDLYASAFLLWGGGVAILCAWVMSSRAPSEA